MTEKIELALTAVATIVRSVTTLKQVPVDPPETISVDTFAVVYAQSGSIDNGVVGLKKSLHSISVDCLTKRTDLARDLARVKPLIDLIPSALLANPTLAGTVQTFGSISYEVVQVEYGAVPMIGYKFLINDVKILF